MVAPTHYGLCLFHSSVSPAGCLPGTPRRTEDQGYSVVVAQLPAGASQLRVRQVSADMDAVLKGFPA